VIGKTRSHWLAHFHARRSRFVKTGPQKCAVSAVLGGFGAMAAAAGTVTPGPGPDWGVPTDLPRLVELSPAFISLNEMKNSIESIQWRNY